MSPTITETHAAGCKAAADLRRWGLCGLSDLLAIGRSRDRSEYLIEGLVGMRQIAILVGDSGIGKSPLIYQGSMCVAAGGNFLGFPTRQAAVIYLDFENGRADAADIVRVMLPALGLTEAPPLWSAWYWLDSPSDVIPAQVVKEWLALPEHEGLPKLVVIDPYEAWPSASIRNEEVRDVFGQFRCWQRQHRVTVLLVHHVNKEPTRQDDRAAMPDLADDPRRWLERARGGKVLINASDLRIGVEESGEESLRIAGFRRGRGNIGPIHVIRHLDDDGEATHYSRASILEVLERDPLRSQETNQFRLLSDPFTTADVKRAFDYEHNEQARRLLRRWVSEGLIGRGDGRGVWRKAPMQFT